LLKFRSKVSTGLVIHITNPQEKFSSLQESVTNDFAVLVYVTVHQHTCGVVAMTVGSCGTCNTNICSKSREEQTEAFI
jgi:hypothetical protein